MQDLLESVASLSPRERKALAVMLGKKGINLFGITPIQPRDRDEPAPLSHAQERQWFLWRLDPQSCAYNMAATLHIRGVLNLQRLGDAFGALVARHEVLRTTFAEQPDGPVQEIAAQGALLIERLSGVGNDEQDRRTVEAFHARPFDLANGPLLRVAVLERGVDDCLLLLTQHHIISDGSSTQTLIREVMALYADQVLPPLPLQYADYAAWQRQWLDAGERERQLGWWRERLGGEATVLPLPFDKPRPVQADARGAALGVRLPDELVQALKARARASDATVFMLLLAAFQGFLYRYSGQADVRVGVPVAGRSRGELEGLLGLFVNTQVYRAQVDGQAGFAQLLEQVKADARQAQSYQDLPFDQLVEALQPQRQLNISPLFQIFFNYQGEQAPSAVLPGLDFQHLDWSTPSAAFDLTLYMRETVDGLSAEFIYPTALFNAGTVQRLLEHWLVWLHAVIGEGDRRLDEVPLLAAGERDQLLHAWNPPATALAVPPPIHVQFVEQAHRTPYATALVFGGQSVSYAQVEQASRSLALALLAAGVTSESLVGVAVQRGPELVVALLAILRAGAAYVPMDPEFPAQRLAYMLEQSGVGLLLTQQAVQAQLAVPDTVQTLCIDGWLQRAPCDVRLDVACVDPDQLAYTLYTSGSTGQPKGVMVSHRALSNFIAAMDQRLQLVAGDRLLSMTTFSFDIFGLELYLPLTIGATVVLASPEQAKDPLRLRELLEECPVKAIQATPSAWRMLLDSGLQSVLRNVLVLCGGEALAPDLMVRLQALSDQVWNLYGPTETTIWSSAQRILPGQAQVLLGQPLDNTALQVLGQDLGPAPLGAAGELLIGGLGLARGYLGRAALTAERFVPDPARPGQRLYRTGDIARYREGGELDYLGRADQQVKIRGFRIELGDIEAQLLLLPQVREAAVKVVQAAGGAQLAAWVVAVEALAPAVLIESLKHALGQRLPAYMLPSQWAVLDAMPLTPNGKLDRNALPAIEWVAAGPARMPGTEQEKAVAAIWEQVLDVAQLGLDADFFERGGHSLLATRITSRVRESLGVDVPLKTLFEHSTLGAFVLAVQSLGGARHNLPLLRAPAEERRRPSFAQQRQWLLWCLQPDSHAYTLPAALRLHGPLDLDALGAAFDQLIMRHEPLRSRFIATGDGVEIDVQEHTPLSVSVTSVDESQVRAVIGEQLHQPFDLAQGPLLRLGVLRLGAQEHVLVLTQHHIVSDAWSMQVMVEELLELYAARVERRAVTLVDAPISYSDYAWSQREWMAAGGAEQQLAYWREQLGEEQPVLNLPFDRARPAQPSRRGAVVLHALGAELSAALAVEARRQGCTPFMLLLAAYQVLLWRYSGQADVRVGVPVAGRNRLETERLIGFFVNTQVHRGQLDAQQSFAQLLHAVRETALQAQQHQDLPFEQLVEALQPQRSLAHSPLFQVLFNHQADTASTPWQAPLGGLLAEPLAWPQDSAKFDLTLETRQANGEITASFIYACDLFDASTIERMAGHYRQVLEALVGQPHSLLGTLTLETHRQPCLVGASSEHSQISVFDLFAQQVRQVPQRVALVEGQQRITFEQLHGRVLDLARAIADAGIARQGRVAVVAERSIDFVVAVLACLHQGVVFIPVDPRQAGQRTLQALQDSAPQLLVGAAQLLAPYAGQGSTVLDPASVVPAPEYLRRAMTPIAVNADELCYLLYTSGSTGTPKGVAVRQGGLFNYIQALGQWLPWADIDTVALVSTVAADLGYTSLFGALCHGRTLHLLATELALDSLAMGAYMSAERIDLLKVVPSHLQALLEGAGVDVLPRRALVLGGEATPPALLQRIAEASPGCEVFNHYGPTETTIGVLSTSLAELPGDALVPLGQAMANLHLDIVDAQLNPQPEGVFGELLVGGAGLAQGYWGQPGLTAERFIPAASGTRRYRTGDRVRLQHDQLVFAGRLDDQIKVRGHRIEPAEIAAAIKALPGISDAVVGVPGGNAAGGLVAWVVPRAGSPLPLPATILGQLAQQLPDYMVPAHCVVLGQLPLTANGKPDRRALPAPDTTLSARPFEAPQGEREVQVAAIWQVVLKCERIGRQDNFFELGGHSLLVMGVVSRVQLELGIKMSPQLLFTYPTLGALVEHLEPHSAPLDATRLSRLEDLFDEVDA
ncbi:amino acid adenylation domain-containing protein [Pseudomonas sp. 18175]|uniref:amino acid adenylation domain-containing protein n=1 Tax=Pseudomonas sp. 18175 TaxID=3390056 RepID=UPI003D19013A